MLRRLLCKLGLHKKPRRASGLGFWCARCGDVVWTKEAPRG